MLPLTLQAARRPIPRLPNVRLTRPASILSAIREGIVKEEHSNPQGPDIERLKQLAAEGKKLTYKQRQQLREALEAERPTYRIRKGKKDITEDPVEEVLGPDAKTRKARFYDPQESFGKDSIVWKLKATGMVEKYRELQKQMGGKATALAARKAALEVFKEGGLIDEERARGKYDDDDDEMEKKGRKKRSGRIDADDMFAELEREVSPQKESDPFAEMEREVNRAKKLSESRGKDTRSEWAVTSDGKSTMPEEVKKARDRPRERGNGRVNEHKNRDNKRDSQSAREDENENRNENGNADESKYPRKFRFPLSIPYTTAASQFLYGKSVVEAALLSARRKLYHLYMTDLHQRKDPSGSRAMLALARSKGVPVTILSDADKRLMDKMAEGRPHNGFVLEASPLPQPPVTALGPLPSSEDGVPKPITEIPVTLDHQSAEDASINGTSPSLPLPSPLIPGYNPLILILDRILDPGNLGSILRTSLFLGASAVGITRHGSAPLSPVTLKASSGAAESLPLFIIPSLPHFLTTTRQNGWTVFAACARDPSVRKNRRHWDLDDVRREEPLRKGGCVLVLGSEGEGLERATVKKADYEVAVPGGGGAAQRVGVESLNVGVAAGLVVEAFMGGVLKAKEGSSGSGELW
ncbi:putative mitochondrial large ribosomal RNA protein [Thermochaetoides thermophila DSM 1495]|uniref:rRNA methyltransferase 1, mitochondrial n=1 Tax=Chaetomium thermophilum (strain DSM 1495 / CBS 144.50 / IMI 039719) TaxID=759272 RepID=G0SDG7_CHATD|nr:putative mitochondrial large ribosomal RNA protein [Thermochaetoides thermophila DSM 1495]EGS18568.1 putative mitochondrial large ribosomal RNA protein [Thermochaetoides thermophila DSM 1495]